MLVVGIEVCRFVRAQKMCDCFFLVKGTLITINKYFTVLFCDTFLQQMSQL